MVSECLIMEPEIILDSLSAQQMGQNPANNWNHVIDLGPPTAPGKNAPNMAQTTLGHCSIDF